MVPGCFTSAPAEARRAEVPDEAAEVDSSEDVDPLGEGGVLRLMILYCMHEM